VFSRVKKRFHIISQPKADLSGAIVVVKVGVIDADLVNIRNWARSEAESIRISVSYRWLGKS